MKFRKKPVVVEAFRFGTQIAPDWCKNVSESINFNTIEIKTLEGKMRATHGDWIIRGIKGEVYPCRADIFEATYERVDS